VVESPKVVARGSRMLGKLEFALTSNIIIHDTGERRGI
jgi:hypothetical protein